MNVVVYTPSSSASPVATYTGVSSIGNRSASPAITIFDISAAAATPTCPSGDSGTYPNCVAPTCPSGDSGTYPNCVAPKNNNGGGGSTGSSGGSSSQQSGSVSNPAKLSSLGAPSQPIQASSVTLTPQIDVPLSEVSKVNYYIDGKLVKSVTTPPFTYKVNSSVLKNGCHNIKTVVYTTVGSPKATSRQLCVAFTGNLEKQKEWAVVIFCIIMMVIVVLEFFPFYPKNRHLISRNIHRLYNRLFNSKSTTLGPVPDSLAQPLPQTNAHTPGDIIRPHK
jgi:hypothetical protein